MSMREEERVPPGKECQHCGCEQMAVKAVWSFHPQRQPFRQLLCLRHARAAMRESRLHEREAARQRAIDRFHQDQRAKGHPWPFPDDPPGGTNA